MEVGSESNQCPKTLIIVSKQEARPHDPRHPHDNDISQVPSH